MESRSTRKAAAPRNVRTTLKAVAEKAGVSKGLASRILNDGSTTIPISQETIRRVKQAAADLRYIPSRMARSLTKGARSHIIGLSIIDPHLHVDGHQGHYAFQSLPDKYQNPIINEIERYHRSNDIGIIINEIARDDQLRGKWDIVVRHRIEASDYPFTPMDLGLDLVEGLIYFHPSNRHHEIVDLARSGIPVVLIGHLAQGENVCSVGIDNRQSSYRLAHHLLSQGRTRVVGLWPFDASMSLTSLRSEGFRECVKNQDLTPLGEVFTGGVGTVPDGYWATRNLLEKIPEVDGIIVGTNSLARGAVYALEESGRRVPEDVALVTFDDNLMNVVEEPMITALRLPIDEMVSSALRKLIKLIEGSDVDVLHRHIEPELIIRQSCGALSAERSYSYQFKEASNHAAFAGSR